MKPSIGRIVIFTHHGSTPARPMVSPAVVHSVNDDGSLNLMVLALANAFASRQVSEGNQPGQWHWPPFVDAQTAA